MATIAEKLKNPFGPYRVVDFLKDRKSLRGGIKHRFVLDSVLFMQAGEVIGFDRMDDLKARDKALVYFKGILEVSNPRWLTQDGELWLRQDLRKCLGKAGKDFDRILRHKDYIVRVIIIGVSYSEPIGLETTGVPTIIACDEKANEMNEFIINSMNVHSYSLSREYLSKFHALRTILYIDQKCQEVPVYKRTPKWLVAEYIKLNLERFEAQNETENYIPRHIHRAEIYAFFGRHSQWLLSKVTKKILNKHAWERFCKEVELRWTAISSKELKVRDDWDDLERLWDDDEDLMSVDDEALVADEPKCEESELEYVDGGYEETYTHVAGRQRSLSLSSETRQSRSRAEEKLTDTAVKDVIPKAFYRQPPIFPPDYIWYCPDRTCSYKINFHCLSKRNLDGITDENDKAFLLSMCWNPACDSKVIELFHDMVEIHYYKHLEKIGVRHVVSRPIGKDVFGRPVTEDRVLTGPRQLKSEDVDSKFEWMKPKNHWPAFHHTL